MLALFAVAYAALSEFGMALRFPPGLVAAFWPAAGLAAAAATFTPRRQWPHLAAALFGSCLLVNLRYNSPGVSAGFSAANTIEPFVFAWLYQEWYLRWRLRRSTTVARIPMLAIFGLFACSVSGAIGAFVLYLDADASFLIGWRTWIASDVTGIILALPLAANWRARPVRRQQRIEMFAASATLAAIALVVVTRGDGHAEISHSIYALFPPLVWIAARIGPRQTAIAGSTLGFAAVWSTAKGYGPFVTLSGEPGDHVLSVQFFLVTLMLSAMAVARTVEDRRRAAERQLEVERALAEREMDVARLAGERERHELEAQLLHSQRLEALGRLAGGIAHDFNNLLGVIQNYASLAGRSRDLDPRVHADLVRIQDAASRGSELTRQLLLFSRGDPESGGTADAVAVTDAVVQLLARSLGSQVELRVSTSGHPLARISAARLEQALVNLVLNAADASGGDGTIDLRVSGPGSDDVVTVSVTDRGSGMPPDVAAQAFEPFFTTKPPGSASGLGLSIVYGIVERAGGHVDIDSELGRGTTVTLRLLAAPPGPCAPASVAPHDGDGIVAVVDDDPDALALTVRLLAAEGIEAVGYTSADALVAALGEGIPHAVVTDVVMPGGSGPDLARELWRRHPGLPVVFVSGYAPAGVVDVDERRATFLTKPFDGAQLADAVRSQLRRAMIT
jgi:signal transduction histidine kinase/CheY-like chemotaxis protein